MKVWIDEDELFPHYHLTKEEPKDGSLMHEIEMTEDLYDSYMAITTAFFAVRRRVWELVYNSRKEHE